MNKLIKTIVIGGVVYGLMEFSYRFGQGTMIGALAKHGDEFAIDCMKDMSNDKRLGLKLVNAVAEFKANEGRP